jgi:hypothetical protein
MEDAALERQEVPEGANLGLGRFLYWSLPTMKLTS